MYLENETFMKNISGFLEIETLKVGGDIYKLESVWLTGMHFKGGKKCTKISLLVMIDAITIKIKEWHTKNVYAVAELSRDVPELQGR